MATHEHYLANKDKYLAKAKAWSLAHPDRRKEIAQKWSETHKDQRQQAQWTFRKQNPVKYLYSLAKRRAKKNQMEFTIEVSDIIIPDKCPLLGIPIDSYNTWQGTHPSIDRIDSTKGYVKGNVMVISHRANILKNNSTPIELLTLALALGHLIGEFR